MANPIPDGFTAVTPYLIVADLEREVAFLTAAFDAVTVRSSGAPGGPVTHVEMHVNGARLMLGRANAEYPPLPAMLYIYVSDADAAFARATAVAGVTVTMPIADQFYGDRSGSVLSADGITYCIAHKL